MGLRLSAQAGEAGCELSQNKKMGTVALECAVGSGLIQGQYIYAGSGSLFSPYQEPAGAKIARASPLPHGRLSYNSPWKTALTPAPLQHGRWQRTPLAWVHLPAAPRGGAQGYTS